MGTTPHQEAEPTEELRAETCAAATTCFLIQILGSHWSPLPSSLQLGANPELERTRVDWSACSLGCTGRTVMGGWGAEEQELDLDLLAETLLRGLPTRHRPEPLE